MGGWRFMKTDSLFYRLFQEFPNIFFELIEQPADEASLYEFRSVEIKQTAFRIDGVLLPMLPHRPVYFTEVQFQRDAQLYHRFFAEVFLYLAQHPTTYDWQGVLIYPNRSVEPESSRLHELLLDSPKVRRIYLDELGASATLPLGVGIVKLVVEPEATAPEQARQLLQRVQQEQVTGISRQAIIELIETIVVYKFTNLSREEIEMMLGLSDLKQTRVYQEAFEAGEEVGEQRGEQKIARRSVLEVLRARFGDIFPDLVQQLEAIQDIEFLAECTRSAATVGSVAEFTNFLNQNQPEPGGG